MPNLKRSLTRKHSILLKELRSLSSLVEGSLVQTKKKCGLLTWKEDGTTKTFYVSKYLLPKVEHAWNSYLRLKQIIKELSSIQRELFKLEGMEHGKRKKQQS